MAAPLIVDAHLDLAWNTTRGRDVTQPAAEQPTVDNETATVGLPDLQRGHVGVVGATLFALPASGASLGENGYTDPRGAFEQARNQLAIYEHLERDGHLRIVRNGGDLNADGLRAIVLMEGADPMSLPQESAKSSPQAWHDAGVRMVGLAWKSTRFAGGTSEPGPLTDDGRTLVAELDRLNFIHDASHLAKQSLDDLLALANGPICASHSNCRTIVGDDPSGRHLPDRQIEAIARRGGIVGMNLFAKFLLPPSEYDRRPATLADFVKHVRHACDLIGDAEHVGLGSDMDGGFGRERIPQELTTAADLPKLGAALSAAGFSDDDVANLLGQNWLRFFREHL